jgi:hypothetical protein
MDDLHPSALHAAAARRRDAVGGHPVLDLQRMMGNANVAATMQDDEQSPVHEVIGSGGGRQLEPEVRADMKARLGHDFSHVRVHDDSRAHESATAVNAHAYTVGSDIVFQRGGYNPATPEGKLTLAHELTHVIQQSEGPVDGTEAAGAIRISEPRDRFELEAAANAEKAVSGPAPAAPSTVNSVADVQRDQVGRWSSSDRGPSERPPEAVVRRAPAPDLAEILSGPRGLNERGVLNMQRLAGNRSTTAVLQRQLGGAPRDTKHPENFPTYEGWLSTFETLPTFPSDEGFDDKKRPVSFDVLGDVAASSDPSAAPGGIVPDPIDPRPGDKFVSHPTDKWVRANLPEELRQTAYRLPADCADIAVILRHVWLFSHHRSEQYRGFIVGFLAGESGHARSKRVHRDIKGIKTKNVSMMVNPYADAEGRPLRSIVALTPLLHPGDILVWAHHAGPDLEPPDPTRRRSGGHTQTIVSITRTGGTITKIVTLQGNQPLPKERGENLRYTPGRRIERRDLDNPTDLTVPGTGDRVWDFGDRHTTLVVAGPPKSGERPAMKEHGRLVLHLADWLPAIAAAPRDRLEGVFEASMREAQAMVERGDLPSEVEGEARSLGQAARVRLARLDAQLAKTHKLPNPATGEGIRATLSVLRTGQGSTAAAAVAKVFTAVSAAFEATVPEPGWSNVGASDPNVGERLIGHIRRIPLEGLPGGSGQAIVAMPTGITGGPQSVDVLLHFHGTNVGYKAARDITLDQIEAQLEGSKRRMLAVLPQGSASADFGPFDADSYLDAVFTTLHSMKIWSSTPHRGSVVLAGHSAGGKVAADLMIGGSISSASELALFDGINGPHELQAIETWVGAQLDSAAAKLRVPVVKGDKTKEDEVLKAVVRLRAYHSGSAAGRATREIRDWPGLHRTLRATIEQWFDSHGSQISPHAASELRAHFQVIATGQRDHNRMVGGQSRPGSGTGALQDALTTR